LPDYLASETARRKSRRNAQFSRGGGSGHGRIFAALAVEEGGNNFSLTDAGSVVTADGIPDGGNGAVEI